jgi:hypothetical protein
MRTPRLYMSHARPTFPRSTNLGAMYPLQAVQQFCHRQNKYLPFLRYIRRDLNWHSHTLIAYLL